jgi:hypothetical protein
MVVDCIVRVDISGILRSPGDLAMRTKGTALGSVRRGLKLTTCVLLLRPTAGAGAFVAAWEAGCGHAGRGDLAEAVLIEVMSDSPVRNAIGPCRCYLRTRAARCPVERHRRSRYYS